MRDVLALTKVNYNACDYSSGLPVTLKFADRVGEILTASPRGKKAPPLPLPVLHLAPRGQVGTAVLRRFCASTDADVPTVRAPAPTDGTVC